MSARGLRTNDLAQRRRAEADDIIHMLVLLDVNKVLLPKFVIGDPDRVPSGIHTADNSDPTLLEFRTLMQDVIVKFTESMNTIVQRLDSLEARLSFMTTSVLKSTPELNKSRQSTAADKPATLIPQDPTQEMSTSNSGMGTDENVAATSWADQAKGLVGAGSKLVFTDRRSSVRLRDQSSTSTVKGVPRQLTCFVSRLHIDVTGEELATFLQSQGILDAQCRKLSAKNGRVFRTSAFISEYHVSRL